LSPHPALHHSESILERSNNLLPKQAFVSQAFHGGVKVREVNTESLFQNSNLFSVGWLAAEFSRVALGDITADSARLEESVGIEIAVFESGDAAKRMNGLNVGGCLEDDGVSPSGVAGRGH
jgi:hypothetical protein